MKVLVIGSGGREHALCQSFVKSEKVEKLYCACGNGGISEIAEIVNINVNDFENLANFARNNDIDFTFVGPEIPLSLGIVDYFEERGLKIVGPSKQASMLESSKIFSKEFMNKYDIPTARFNKFTNTAAAIDFLSLHDKDKKIVIKADGLAAGKGVYICNGRKEAENAVKQMMNDKILGDAGTNIIIEEYISGQELSYLIFTDGISYSMMPASQDHKRINDDDEGPNTGGMGAYAPAPLAAAELNKKIEESIIKKVIKGIKKEGLQYKGILYVGVIINDGEPYVLEFNCRFGDPETQVILPLLDSDLSDICMAILNKELSKIEIKWKRETTVCVVLASGGYPRKFESGFEIKGLQDVKDKDTIIFHAGTKIENGKTITCGGRVLGVMSAAGDIKRAIDKVYSQVKLISFENMHYRKDIARRALNGK
ncbi:MAG: phosphoribosylamine--glycine ligase [Endomicrobium sp.]|jgi:phosphoribosylamine--glycine ligase|nr:phosphoribosylamine--glycine ligase [Endomicrobium sp.]